MPMKEVVGEVEVAEAAQYSLHTKAAVPPLLLQVLIFRHLIADSVLMGVMKIIILAHLEMVA